MDLEQLYDKKIKDLEREIRNLKTTHIKTATTINTMTQNITVNFSLMLDALSSNIYSTQRAVVILTTSDSSNMISACYLYNATPVSLNDRFVSIKRLKANNGVVRFGVAVFSQNINDYNTLAGGGSVNLSYTLQLVGSSEFNSSVIYKPIAGGTL